MLQRILSSNQIVIFSWVYYSLAIRYELYTHMYFVMMMTMMMIVMMVMIMVMVILIRIVMLIKMMMKINYVHLFSLL